MEQKVKSFIIENKMNINNDTIICAVSGGVDSICLLNILNNLGYKIVLAHVNHHKRKESELEQKAMESLAKSLNIPFELLDYFYDGKDNFHNDSHNARYSFFKSLCKKYNTSIIATAHHLDDQIETILIKLLEGSNLYGYGGISIVNDDGEYKIIRPLLCVSKSDLYIYANDNKITYFEDCSNSEDIFLRNRIRHNIVPLLNREIEDLYSKISQYSIQVKEAFNFIRKQSIEYLNKTNNIIDLVSFNELDIALKKDILSLLLENNNIRRSNLLIIDILKLLKSNRGTKAIDLENNYKFIRSYDKAYIKKQEISAVSTLKIDLNDVVIFNNKYKFYFSKKIPVNNAKFIKLCYNDLELPFYIRNKKDGDFITLDIGTKKVNRIFIDSKIPRNERNQIPIITDCKDNILWIYDFSKSKDVVSQKNAYDLIFICEEI